MPEKLRSFAGNNVANKISLLSITVHKKFQCIVSISILLKLQPINLVGKASDRYLQMVTAISLLTLTCFRASV